LIGAFAVFGGYTHAPLNFYRELFGSTLRCVLRLAIVVSLLALFPGADINILIGAAVALLVVRGLVHRACALDYFRRRVLILGRGRHATTITRLRRRSDLRNFQVVGFMATEGDQTNESIPVLSPGDTLLETSIHHEVDEIVEATYDRRRQFPMDQLLDCRKAGLQLTSLVAFLERETGLIHLEVLNPSAFLFAGGRDSLNRDPPGPILKRATDIVVSGALLTLCMPLMLLAA
jgi:FlaA1/EpsC-like NDP-sugar epimerase